MSMAVLNYKRAHGLGCRKNSDVKYGKSNNTPTVFDA